MHARTLNDAQIMNPVLAAPSAIEAASSRPSRPRLSARLACSEQDVVLAQTLRAEVFGSEYGVDFEQTGGIDRDHYDAFCQHVMIFDDASGALVATTRLLGQEQAERAGGFYSAQEFDLSALSRLSGKVLEVGRTCVHPAYRSGAAIGLLWSTLAEHLLAEGYDFLIGCASISLADGGTTLAGVMPNLRDNYLVGPELRVSPARGILLAAPGTGPVAVPPLLKAYLRMGCRIGGEACWDPEFNCADVFIVLDVEALSGRYAQRFLRSA